jgi:CBS-domain-containing membrane protein
VVGRDGQPGADLERAAVLMFERRLGSLPVMEDGRVVGILTERDVFETLRDEAEPRSWRSFSLVEGTESRAERMASARPSLRPAHVIGVISDAGLTGSHWHRGGKIDETR